MPVHQTRARVTWCLAAALALFTAACSSDGGSAVDQSTTAGVTTTSVGGGTEPAPELTGDGPAVASAGCDAADALAADGERHIDVDGMDRWYLLAVPTAYLPGEPMPLVLDYHGYSEGAPIHTIMSNLGALGEDQGFLVATPQGSGDIPKWDFTTEAPLDVPFTEAMLDDIGADFCVDTSRVYTTGLSNGAFFSSILSCRLADRIAAAAPVAGIDAPEPCEPARAVPVLGIHGTADDFVTWDGSIGEGAALLPTEDGGTIADLIETAPDDTPSINVPIADKTTSWAVRNGCEETFEETQVSENVRLWTYDCPVGAEVQLYIVDGGGHAWPGSEASAGTVAIIGPTTFEIDANELMWAFFQDHQLPAD